MQYNLWNILYYSCNRMINDIFHNNQRECIYVKGFNRKLTLFVWNPEWSD